MKNKSPVLSVCIVNYNAQEYLGKCLESIFKNPTKYPFEVILIDNNSDDGSAEYVKAEFPQVRLVQNPENIGFIRANNQALKLAQGKYLLSLNNDTIVFPDSLDSLVKYAETHPTVGAVGPKVLNSDGTVQHQCKRGLPTPWNTLAYMLRLDKVFSGNPKFSGYLLTHLDTTQDQSVYSLSGCCMMVRRDVANKLGYMDEDYIMYGDDIDWSFRIKKAGFDVVYTPSSKIIHFGGAGGSAKQPYRCLYYFYRAAYRFYKKHLAENYFFLVNWIVYLGIWAKFISTLLANTFRKEKVIGSVKPKA